MFIVSLPSKGVSETVSDVLSVFPVAPANGETRVCTIVDHILLARDHLHHLVIPRVLPAQQYRSCTKVSANLGRMGAEAGLLAPRWLPSRTVFLCAVHQLELSVSSCSLVNWLMATRAYKEPHAGAQTRRAEAVERRHMWSEAGWEALEGLLCHCRNRSIQRVGNSQGRVGVYCESEVEGTKVVLNERSSVSWQVVSQCAVRGEPPSPHIQRWPVRFTPAGLRLALYP